jgi:hypothetical protein
MDVRMTMIYTSGWNVDGRHGMGALESAGRAILRHDRSPDAAQQGTPEDNGSTRSNTKL